MTTVYPSHEEILSEEFLAKYRNKHPKWGFNGLGYLVFLRTYSRTKSDGTKERWDETVERCIRGAQKIGAKYTKQEAERLYDYVFNLKGCFSGRGLWQLGTPLADIYADSLLNCWGTKVSNIDDFAFIFMESMFGGGVGINITKEFSFELPRVKKTVRVVFKNTNDADFIVPDSKEGWRDLWIKILESYLVSGKSFTYSTICIRPEGSPLKTFGGIAPGPRPLIEGTQALIQVLESREGKKLRTEDVTDIINIGGEVVKSGGIRRCLPAGSLIHSMSGLIPIENIKVGDLVLTNDGYHKVLDWINQGSQDIYRIYTQDGWFDATSEHRMAVLTNDNQIEWKLTKNLSNKDLLLTSRIPIEGTHQTLPLWKYDKSIHSTTCKDIKIPDLDKDMAWFIGVFQADGYTCPRYEHDGYGSYVSVIFGENEYEQACACKTQIERFGLDNIKLYHRKNENSWIVTCKSKQLSWYLDQNIKQANTELKIPNFILKSPINIRMAYVSGIFDGDGCITNRPVNICTSVYPEFTRNLQTLLYSCGISTRIQVTEDAPSRQDWKTIYKLNIINNIDKKIWNKWYFGYKNQLIIQDNVRCTNKFPINWFDKKNLKYIYCQYMTYDKYLDEFNQIPPTPVGVISIEKLSKQDTYDISVDQNHNFYCNGYLTHNTAIILGGDSDDIAYLSLKRWDLGNIPYYRSNSNNSIIANYYKYLTDRFWEGYYGNGEAYGLINIRNARRFGRIGEIEYDDFDLKEPNVIICNPCQPHWAPLLTVNGIKKLQDINIGDMIWSKDGWTKVTNKRSNGIKEVYEYKTTANTFFGTKDHKIISNGNKIEVGLSESIDILPGLYSNEITLHVQDVMDGLVLGDGTVHKASNNLVLLCIGQKDQDYFNSEIKELIKEYRPGIGPSDYEINTTISANELALTYLRKIPDRFYYGDKNKICGFLRGLFSANGSISGDRVTLKQSSEYLIRQVQIMLSAIGIRSYITTNKAKKIEFSNGEYLCKESYDINIATDREKFNSIIGFIQIYKNEGLEQLISDINSGNPKKFTYDIVQVNKISEEEVFDITVDNQSHTYWTGGCNVSNCGEALLCDKEPCNLSELFINNINSLEEAIDLVKLLYKTNKAICARKYYHEESNKVVHKNFKIGISLSGVCQKLDVVNEWADKIYVALRKFDKEWSEKNGYPQSIRLTVIQPSGTKGLLGGCMPGGHPGYAEYFIRRIRFASNDPLIPLLKQMGVYTEFELKFDGGVRHDVIVAEFPCRFENGLLSKDCPAIKQMNIVKDLQKYWADQSVSVTVYYKEEELSDIKQWLEENYDDNVKTMSFLRHSDHGFKQAPYQEITKDEYEMMIKKMKPLSDIDLSKNIGSEVLDGTECTNGICPVR